MELNKKLATFVKVQKGSRPSAIRGKSARKTRGCLAWEKQNQNQ